MTDPFPRYWMNETTGIVQHAIESYLSGHEMSPEDLYVMRQYLHEWITHPAWRGDNDGILTILRMSVNEIKCRDHLKRWLALAISIGIDPL